MRKLLLKFIWYWYLAFMVTGIVLFAAMIAVLMPAICLFDHKAQDHYYKALGYPDGIHHSYTQRFKHYFTELYELRVERIAKIISQKEPKS